VEKLSENLQQAVQDGVSVSSAGSHRNRLEEAFHDLQTSVVTWGVVLALTLLTVVPDAGADQQNQATRLTFNQPVEVPGNMVLPAGTYCFMVPDHAFTASQFVQIFNSDQPHLITTVEAIPATRAVATDRSELTFAEQSQGRPVALISWYYPGLLMGHELVYSPRQEKRLAENEQITLTVQTAAHG
jgi:hypothetical protein